MTTPLSSVVDTNTLVSATIIMPRSTPARALAAARAHGRVLASSSTLAELLDVLRRPKFDRYVPLLDRLEFTGAYGSYAMRVVVTQSITACRDPKDNHLLELAVCGQATHIITGDADLLALYPFQGISILTPADFVAQFPQPGT